MYEGLATGAVTTYGTQPMAEESDSLLVIDRIESADGTLLYKPEQHVKTVLGPKERISIGHVLENVIKFGTGRQADKVVRLASDDTPDTSARNIKVPLFGKTGTANDYTNASFFGYLPGVATDGDGLTAKNGYAVGTYVGFDDNTPMRKSSIRISGAAGALPTWIEIVNSLIREDDYAAKIDQVNLSFNGLTVKREQIGQLNLLVEQDSGGTVVNPVGLVDDSDRGQPSILTFGTLSADGRYVPARNYEPFWRVGDKLQ
jgi:membrane peptidoglycan carboxypeptidase